MGKLGRHYLSLRLLDYWVVVVEEGSFTAAANRLSIPQPSLSQQIRSLEALVGGPLLERLPGGVRLTDAGRAMLPEARATLAAADRTTRSAQEALGLERGLLRIGTYPSLACGILLPSFRVWHARYPNVHMRILESAHNTLVDRVARGLADFGVGLPPNSWSGPLSHVGYEEFVLVVPRSEMVNHRGQSADLAAYSDRDWVLYDRRGGLAQLAGAACATAGFQPRGAVETSQVDAAARLAAAGFGPALVPRSNVPADVSTSTLQLSTPILWEVAAYTRRAWSPGAAAYLKLLSDDVGSKPHADGVILHVEQSSRVADDAAPVT